MSEGGISPVYFFYPNLIGYVRVIAAIGAFAVATTQPYLFFFLYGLSQLLDAFDGYAARAFNQSTKFGAVLDMVTDRASTACLWCVLAGQYPDYAMAFQAMLALDILSHFARLFATMSGGSKSHKDVKPTGNIFLYYYYSKRWVLFILCMGHEVVFMLLYFLASLKELKMDPSGLAAQIALYALYINLPLCALKEWMNAVQFWQSMVDIVAIDMEERRAAGLEPASTASSKSAPAKAPKSPKAAAASPASPKSSGRRKKFAE